MTDSPQHSCRPRGPREPGPVLLQLVSLVEAAPAEPAGEETSSEGTAHSRPVTHSNPVSGVRFLALGALGPAQPEGGRYGAKEGAAEERKPFSLLEA